MPEGHGHAIQGLKDTSRSQGELGTTRFCVLLKEGENHHPKGNHENCV